MLHFATFFDSNYLSRGVALYESLKEHSSDLFTFYVLSLDRNAGLFFKKPEYANVRVLYLEEMENEFPELLDVKKSRSIIEYYFTLSPFLPSFIFRKFEDIDQVTTLDSDIYFFSDPTSIFNKYAGASILVTPHNFSDELHESRKYGIYNVSFQSFKNNSEGNKCLDSWRNQCIEWCFDRLDEKNNRYADQKYLDSWQSEFSSVEEITLPGAGLAPWNVNRYELTIRDGKIFVDNQPLVYFHFHQLRIFSKYFASNAFDEYYITNVNRALKRIYHLYLRRLASISNRLSAKDNITIRYHSNHASLVSKLTETKGYWFFWHWFIYYVNPARVSKLKHHLQRFYGKTD